MNVKLPIPLVLTCSALLLAPFATAQFRSGMPAPLPGLPMTAPPVDHPALGAQPLMGDNGRPKAGGAKAGTKPAPGKAMPEPVPGTVGPQKEGKDLKKAVAKVNSLKWCESLGDAKARSAATGKPILLLQALGDLEGFA